MELIREADSASLSAPLKLTTKYLPTGRFSATLSKRRFSPTG